MNRNIACFASQPFVCVGLPDILESLAQKNETSIEFRGKKGLSDPKFISFTTKKGNLSICLIFLFNSIRPLFPCINVTSNGETVGFRAKEGRLTMHVISYRSINRNSEKI